MMNFQMFVYLDGNSFLCIIRYLLQEVPHEVGCFVARSTAYDVILLELLQLNSSLSGTRDLCIKYN